MSSGEEQIQQNGIPTEGDVDLETGTRLDTRRVARGAGISFLGQGLMQAGGMVTTWVFARFLGSTLFGRYTIALAVIRVAAVIAVLGIDWGAVRFVAVHRGEGNAARVKGSILSAVSLVAGAGVLIALCIFVLAGPIATDIFHKRPIGPLLRVFAVLVPIMALELVITGALRGLKRMKHAVVVENIAAPWLAWILGGFLILALHMGATGAAVGHIGASATAVVIGVLFISRAVPLFRRSLEAIPNPKEILRYSLPLYTNSILTQLQYWGDTLLLGKFIPQASNVGIYRVAARTGFVGRSQVQAISTIFAPTVADHYHQGRLERVARLFQTTTRWGIMTGLPLYVYFWLFPGVILSLFGGVYAGGADVLRVVCIGHAFHVATGASGYVLAMTGHQRMNMYVGLGSLAITVGLIVLLVPQFGLMGAAWATTTAVVFTKLCYIIAIARLLRMQPYNWATLRPIGATVGAGIVAWWVAQHWLPVVRVLDLIPSFIIFSIAYAAFLRFVGFEPEDGEVWERIKEKLRPSKNQ